MLLVKLSDAVSRELWRFLAVISCLGVVVVIMLALNQRIEEQSGYTVFDIPTSTYTREDLKIALTRYDDQAVVNVWTFYALDFVFPFLGALITATLAAWGMRNAWPKAYERGKLKRWLPVFFIGALFDWLENVAFLVTLSIYPPANDDFISTYFLAQTAKIWVGPISAVALAVFIYGLIKRTTARVKGLE